jgi:hypothetical protein
LISLESSSRIDYLECCSPAYKFTISPERKSMTERSDPITCDDDVQRIMIHLPCLLAERAEKYANENGNTITGVVIEALDTFLRSKKPDLYGW